MLWPRGGRGPQQKEAGQQQARLAGQAIKPGQGASFDLELEDDE